MTTPAKIDARLISFKELEVAAEAAQKLEPLRLVEMSGKWSLRNSAGIVLDVHRNARFPVYMAENEAYAMLYQAATPAVVLALVKTVGALEAQVTTLQGDGNSYQSGYDEGRRMGVKHQQDEIDRLTAELEALKVENQYMADRLEPVAESTKERRQQWVDNIREARFAPIPRTLRAKLELTEKEIRNSMRYGGTKRLRDQLEGVKRENRRLEADNKAVRLSCVELAKSEKDIRSDRGRMAKALAWLIRNAQVFGVAPDYVTSASSRALHQVAEDEKNG